MVKNTKSGVHGRRKVSMCARCTKKCKQLPFVDTLFCPHFERIKKPDKKPDKKKPLGKETETSAK